MPLVNASHLYPGQQSPISTMAQDSRLHLVIIGSGWAGYYIAQYIDTTIYSVSVISPRRTSAYTPLLASAACGLFPFSCAEESVRVPGCRYRFIKANASSIDFDNKRVHCEPAFDDDDDAALAKRFFDIAYDLLIICPGCRWKVPNSLYSTNDFKAEQILSTRQESSKMHSS